MICNQKSHKSHKLHLKQTKDSSVPAACNQNNSYRPFKASNSKDSITKRFFMKTPLLRFTHVPHAVQGSVHWALIMAARPTKLGSLSTKTSSNKANSFLNLLRLYPHPHQPQGQVAKPRPIASLMHQPWCEGATANLSNLTQIRQQIKNLFHAKNLSYWFIQRD